MKSCGPRCGLWPACQWLLRCITLWIAGRPSHPTPSPPSLSQPPLPRYAQLASAARSTLEDLLSLQHTLMDRHPAIAAPQQQQQHQTPSQQPDPASEDGDEGGDGTSSSTDALWARISSHHASLSAFHCPALDSWHRRTVLASGAGALRNRGLRALAQSVSSQVAAIMRDPGKRGKGAINMQRH